MGILAWFDVYPFKLSVIVKGVCHHKETSRHESCVDSTDHYFLLTTEKGDTCICFTEIRRGFKTVPEK